MERSIIAPTRSSFLSLSMNANAHVRTDLRTSLVRANIESQYDRPRVAVVLTRAITEVSGFGRIKTLREIRKALGEGFEVTELRIYSVLETRRIRDFVTAASQWLLSLLAGQPAPLQTVLYSAASEIERLAEVLSTGSFDAIYLDSVRCQILMRKVRARLPAVHVVVDLDDLMSRRMEQLTRRRVPLSLGFLQNLVPKSLQWLIQGPFSGMLTRYEAAALDAAEREMVQSAQAVVLVSSAERDILRLKVAPEARKIVHSVPPPAPVCAEASSVASPFRFVFVGSDRLAQNRLSIDFLLHLWRRLSPTAHLHIYGRQDRNLPQIRNVRWHGFVEDVSAAYTSGSIMLLPCLLPGGIKTKVIEAWSFGCPVLGNPMAFEGVEIPDYPLTLRETDWANYLRHPDDYTSTWTSAARMGNTFVRATLSSERYGIEWRKLVAPSTRESKPSLAVANPRLVPVAGVTVNDLPS